MSIECGYCERDLRGDHDPDCPRVTGIYPESSASPACSTADLDRIKDLETVLQMVKDNDIARYMRTGEFGNGELVRKEIDRVLGR